MNQLELNVRSKAQKGEDLKVYRLELNTERLKLEKFFDRYLEDFSSRMSPEKPDTPEWKLYNTKMKEYEEIEDALALADYYINKA